MNRTELQTAVLAKASGDAAFRQALLENPRETIAAFSQIEIPPEVEISVVEETRQRLCLVLPASSSSVGELSDSELEGVAGGGKLPRRYTKEELNSPDPE